MKKRILGLFFVCLMATMLSTTAFATGETWTGDGSSTDPYEIVDQVDLELLATNVNDGTDYDGVYFKLTASIELTGEWTPIGKASGTAFTGTFDGNNCTISGLNVTGSSDYAGLFGYIDGATIKDLTVEGTVSGGTYVGGIVGYAEGTFKIENCTFGSEDGSSTVSGTQKVAGILGGTNTSATNGVITGCTNNGTITITAADQEQAAGIVGYAHTVTISNCTNNGTVTNASDYTAGIVAYTNSCDIDGCTNNGTITGTTNVGGIVGMNKADSSYKSSIDNCANTGTVAGTSDYGQIVGSETNFTLGATTANTESGSIVEVYTGAPLTFADDTENKTTDCYTWDLSESTLTLTKDMTIDAGDSMGIYVYTNNTDATIELAGFDLTITTTGSYGIAADDDLTIQDSSTNQTSNVTITSNQYGIGSTANDITIDGGTYDIDVINTSSDTYGIKTNGVITIKKSILDIDTIGYGIYTDTGSIAVETSTIDITAGRYGVDANGGAVTITSSTIDITADDKGIDAGNLTITSSSIADKSDYGIDVGAITNSGTSSITADYISYTSLTDNDTLTLNVVYYAYQYDEDSENYVLYGAVEDSGGMFYDTGSLVFEADASLTTPTGSTTDLSGYTIIWDNAKFINNGTLILPSGTVYDTAMGYITNNGEVIIGTTAYDADGNQSTAPFYGTLELEEGVEYDGSDYGFTWTKSDGSEVYDTLTIGESGLTIIASSGHGLIVRDDTTIVLNGDLDITSGYGGNGIYASSDVTIQGTGNVNITAGQTGIYSSAGDITITTTGDVDIISSDNSGIGGGDITIENSTVNITSWVDSSGIVAYNSNGNNGDITIKNATVTVVDVYAEGNLEISGSAVVEADYIGADGTVEISGSAVVNVGAYVWAPSTVTVDATLNGVVLTNLESGYAHTIYGTVVVESSEQAYSMFWDGTLAFADGSDFTINAGATVDWTDYTITWDNANITNNGVVYVDEAYAETTLAYFSGDGYVVFTDGTYNADGTIVGTVSGTDDGEGNYSITLTTAEVEESATAGYTWLKDEDGVYTLTFMGETLVTCPIAITVDDAIIDVSEKLTVTDMITTAGNLTITGEATASLIVIQTAGVLTIDSDATVVAEYMTMGMGGVVINGDFTAMMLVAVDSLTVNNGATVTLTGIDLEEAWGIPNAPTVALALIDSSFMTEEAPTAPTLILGDSIGILTPTDGEYKTAFITGFSEYDFYFGSIATGDDGFEQGDWSNIAAAVSIGYVKTTTSTSGSSSNNSSSSTTTSTTTNDDGSATTTVDTSATTSNGTTSATVKDSVIDSAIEDAVDEADGEAAHVEIAVDTKTSTDTVEVELTTDAITAVADSDVESLTITSDLGTISIPSDALAEIASAATGSDIVITVQHLDVDEHLNDAQASIVGEALVIDLIITSDGETITSFGGHEIEVSLPYELKDGEIAENIVVWYIDDDGIITPMETVYDTETETVTFKTSHFSVFAVIHDINDFTDIDVNAYYYNAVMWAVEMGITKGTSDTTFSPEKVCTRAEAVMFLWNAAGNPEATGDMIFTDVDADSYYYDAVLWAVENGITKGTSDTTFSPNETCTRSQIVTFLWNYAGNPVVNYLMTFTDVDADTWYSEAVRWAVSEGITTGTDDTTFSPDADCTRGQIVTFLYRNLAE